MTNPPFFRSPFYPSHYPHYPFTNSSRNPTFLSTSPVPEEQEKISSHKNTSSKENSSKYYAFGPIRFKNPIFDNKETPIFEILGIQLYLDDILILSLLFFLYKEEVKDEFLFICLILLLLS